MAGAGAGAGAAGAGAGVGVDVEVESEISNKELEGCDVDVGVVAGAEEEELENKDNISALAFLAGAADVEAVGAGVISLLDPKMSARRSCVDGPAAAPPWAAGGGAASSPIKSTNEPTSVRVDPTGFLSLAEESQLSRPDQTLSGSSPVPPMIVALISGGGILSRTPALTSPRVNNDPNSTARCCISSSRLPLNPAKISAILSCCVEAEAVFSSAKREDSLADAVRTN